MLPGDCRDDVKHHVFIMFYDRGGWRSNVGKRIATRFPTIDMVLQDLKQREYQHVARLMQHAESSLMIGDVCGSLMRDSPGAPIVTIHDSILTTPENADRVESAILTAFRLLGVCPTLHDEG
jgi:hypothetical protein